MNVQGSKGLDGPAPWLTGSSLSTTPPTKLSSLVSLSFYFCFWMLIALAWLATGVAKHSQLTNHAHHQRNWLSSLFISSYSSTIFTLLTELNFSSPSCRLSSFLAPLFRLPKPPHPPSFQIDSAHNCSSIPSHNSTPPTVFDRPPCPFSGSRHSCFSVQHLTHTPSKASHAVVMQR